MHVIYSREDIMPSVQYFRSVQHPKLNFIIDRISLLTNSYFVGFSAELCIYTVSPADETLLTEKTS